MVAVIIRLVSIQWVKRSNEIFDVTSISFHDNPLP
jgi:hypothetical protein